MQKTTMNSGDKKFLLETFKRLYPEPKSELNFKNDYELIVSVILSAQCTDKKVNETTPALFRTCPDFQTLANAPVATIEELIRPVNYYKTKSKNIKLMAAMVIEKHMGLLPCSMDELVQLPGVGRKTASVILCEQGKIPAFPVDTHVLRVSNRLGIANGDKPLVVEEQITGQFPSSTWHDLHHWLIFHGRRVCSARSPQCSKCAISEICPSKEVE